MCPLWWKLEESSQQQLKHTLPNSQQRRSNHTLSRGCFESGYSSRMQHCWYHGGWIDAFPGKYHLEKSYNHLFWCTVLIQKEYQIQIPVTNGKVSVLSLGFWINFSSCNCWYRRNVIFAVVLALKQNYHLIKVVAVCLLTDTTCWKD